METRQEHLIAVQVSLQLFLGPELPALNHPVISIQEAQIPLLSIGFYLGFHAYSSHCSEVDNQVNKSGYQDLHPDLRESLVALALAVALLTT